MRRPALRFRGCLLAAILLGFGGFSPQARAQKSVAGADIIGTVAPEFVGLNWLTTKPLTVAGLKGKPFLIRFWFAGCSMCEGSVPTLNFLHEKYGARGLVVIGIHHPKGKKDTFLTKQEVMAVIKEWSIAYPVALDNDWKTVNLYWTGKGRDFTSASILVGRDGRIKWVHPGGVLPKDSADTAVLQGFIEQELARM